ncbi:zinc ribbon domain-containing protein [Albibacillus kandeliae]|uniref:zinc ribbon domain-containing protein n=1 Tax=Albibacillus kandeliae TaxID=2174228 RepID=UPI000D69C471|nr:zinc ribbon domain-containing protein [Albibacillus kandeliae]
MSAKCQSCGMPLSRDPLGGGAEADGSRSRTYCSHCYDNGAFRAPDASFAEFQAHCIEMLVAKRVPRPLAWLMTRGMQRLDRWRGD